MKTIKEQINPRMNPRIHKLLTIILDNKNKYKDRNLSLFCVSYQVDPRLLSKDMSIEKYVEIQEPLYMQSLINTILNNIFNTGLIYTYTGDIYNLNKKGYLIFGSPYVLINSNYNKLQMIFTTDKLKNNIQYMGYYIHYQIFAAYFNELNVQLNKDSK